MMRSTSMLSVATLALGLFAAAALPGAARAQAPGQAGADTSVSANEQRAAPYMLMIYPNGTVVQMPVDKAMAAEAMKSAKPLGTPMVIMVMNSKGYSITNVKMANGKMIYDAFGDDISRMMHERNYAARAWCQDCGRARRSLALSARTPFPSAPITTNPFDGRSPIRYSGSTIALARIASGRQHFAKGGRNRWQRNLGARF